MQAVLKQLREGLDGATSLTLSRKNRAFGCSALWRAEHGALAGALTRLADR